MTERLYYTDSYQTEFDAQITGSTEIEGRQALILDRTHFYPTSGGQPHDTGVLGEWRVVNVVAVNDEVYHVLADPVHIGDSPQPIRGVIDWPRRHDHMQQHSGQHLISQVFYRLFGYETVSVHFGAEDSTLDLDVASLDPEQMDKAEQVANDLVCDNLPIRAYFVLDSELDNVPVRRPPKVTGEIRIVEIAEFDYSACGGTHCHSTAEIGAIKFTRQEKRRGQTRITFRCGKRAYRDYTAKHQLIVDAAALYSTEIGQVPELIARNLEQIKELQHRVDKLTEQQLAYEAENLVQSAQSLGEYRLVSQQYRDKNVNTVKTLAHLLQAMDKTIALLACADGPKATVVFARHTDVPLHAGNLLRAALAEYGGGGGGRPDFAQGGGVSPDVLAVLLEFAGHKARKELGQSSARESSI
jgi:alanyl-tRNA synthetase